MSELKVLREKAASLHALIVDDEDEIRFATVKFMKKFCVRVDGAQNGEVALKMIKENGPYDILLTDVRMPKLSGWDLAEAVRNIDDEIFIAVMTGSPELDGACMDSCDIYIPKPVDLANMQLMLEMIIKKKGL